MKEYPILFSAPMVRVILNGTKTQTRRIIKPQPDEDGLAFDLIRQGWVDTSERFYKCRYGKPGDRLWVRETCRYYGIEYHAGKASALVEYKADGGVAKISLDDPPHRNNWTKLTPSIHMPRWASRITLEITNVRVERLQTITEKDVMAEGVKILSPAFPRLEFIELWNSLNASRGFGWNKNLWVWVVEFKRIEA